MTSPIRRLVLAVLAGGFVASAGALADARAEIRPVIVGINDYAHFPDPGAAAPPTDLAGARNDAQEIARALRSAGVVVPPEQLLIDDRATLSAFLQAWDRALAGAGPDDVVLVTFSGHGGQEIETRPPFDETTDGRDETLLFHDFDPARPSLGRLTDDALQAMFLAAAPTRIVFVSDACHAAGLERDIAARITGLSRNAGVWELPLEEFAAPAESAEAEVVADAVPEEGAAPPPHVTQVFATASESRLVMETSFEGEAHGALSWFFARAIDGEADADEDGVLSQAELGDYLEDRVFTAMEQQQQPRVVPRDGAAVALPLGRRSGTTARPSAGALDDARLPGPVSVHFVGPAPFDLAACAVCVPGGRGAAVTFEAADDGWTVYNRTGDRIMTVASVDAALAQVRRAQLVATVDALKDPHLAPAGVAALQPPRRHPIGTIVGFRFTPPSSSLAYLTLFNIASDGAVQWGLEPPGVERLAPLRGPATMRFRVAPPAGADQLVALFCERPPLGLHDLLRRSGGAAPEPERVVAALGNTRCQAGRIGLFTGP
ncbi:caspase family protein [Acuticoccus mangrovi]|uniref:Caspase family protein n=1 Tax=Acuticoccus mangrovi TaxID=2796142 RepID=A0A934MIN0_9HYPH|nr:caspase family protein [Acuticoccus mangrovi]